MIRVATPDDRDAIRRVVRAAFGRDEEVDLVERIWSLPEHVAELELVAIIDGTVVGHVLHSVGYVNDHRLLALAPLSVHPAHQRMGVGQALLRDAIARAGDWPAIVLLGHPDYYPRVGFRPARDLGIEPPMDLPTDPDPFMALPLASWDPAIRGRFRYAWDEP